MAVPALLVVAAWLSVLLFGWLEDRLQDRFGGQGSKDAEILATSRTRLIATFLALNTFFWFVDPSQGLLGVHGGQLVRSLLLAITAIWLFRGWGRDPAAYRRESTSESLRKQLRDRPGLQEALDGRSLEQLSPPEVFTLAKALPAVGQQQSLEMYRSVLSDMLRTGRLERAQSLLQLQDLRDVLKLEDQDHHDALRCLAQEHPDLLRLDQREHQVDDLRREAVAEALEDLMATAGMEVLDVDTLRPALHQRLESLRADCGLNQEAWEEVLQRYGPRGGLVLQRLEEQRADWIRQAALTSLLEQQASEDPLKRPLALAMALRLASLASWLSPRLQAAELAPLPERVEAAGSLEEALDALWQDPDPDTAGWVLLVERRQSNAALERRLRLERSVQSQSAFLTLQCQGGSSELLEKLRHLCCASLFADLLPAGLVWLAGEGFMRSWQAGEEVIREGDRSDGLLLVIGGEARLQTRDGREVLLPPGETIGEMGVITGNRRSRTVVAGSEGMRSFDLSQATFEELMRRSRDFSRGLLRLLALRLTAA